MSQKTNPLSLRLQKSNQNFASPWFSDFFFSDNYHYQFEIEKYINKILKETHLSKAFFTAKTSYRKSNIFLVIQDIRAEQKEKQISFNFKQNLSIFNNSLSVRAKLSFLEKTKSIACTHAPLRYTYMQKSGIKDGVSSTQDQKSKILPYGKDNEKAKQSTLLKIQEQIYRNYTNSLPKVVFKKGIEEKKEQLKILDNLNTSGIAHGTKSTRAKRFSMGANNKNIILAENHLNSLLSLKRISLNNFTLSFTKDDYHTRTNTQFAKILRDFTESKKQKEIQIIYNREVDFIFSFRKKVRETFLKLRQNYNSKLFFCSQRYFKFFVENHNFYKNENHLKNLWEVYLKNRVTKNNCISFCEKTVKESSLPFRDNVFLKSKYTTCVPFFEEKCVHNNSSGQIKKRTLNGGALDFTLQNHSKNLQDKFVFPTFLSFSKQQKQLIKNEISIHNLTSLFPVTTYYEPIRFIRDTQSVKSLLYIIVALIEKRVAFRQIKSKLFQSLSRNAQVKGARISCSGRLGGRSKKAQKAKMQSDQWGETSLNAFSSKVLFASKSAYTPYGKVGIKIWLSFK